MLKLKAKNTSVNMSKVLMLRCLVNERLTAAAEEIFALFERTIAEYEEELCRSKEENQRKQQILDSARLQWTGVQIESVNPEEAEPILNPNFNKSPQIKDEPEEHSIKSLEEQLQEFAVKSEEHTRPVEYREASGGEETDYTLGTFQQSSNDHENWECSTEQTESDGNNYNQVNNTAVINSSSFLDFKPANNISAETNNVVVTYFNGKSKVHECPVCKKRFTTNQSVQIHRRLHTGEKPYRCPFCEKCFTQKAHLKTHIRTHTKERPYSCTVCTKSFMHKVSLNIHMEKFHHKIPLQKNINMSNPGLNLENSNNAENRSKPGLNKKCV